MFIAYYLSKNSKSTDKPVTIIEFMRAVTEGDAIIVRKHLQLVNANPNVKNEKGDSALIMGVKSASKNRDSIVKMLLATPGIEVNIKDKDGRTPLIWAAILGRLNITEWLINAGADINVTDCYGYSALMRAQERTEREKNLEDKQLADAPYSNIVKLLLNCSEVHCHAVPPDLSRFYQYLGGVHLYMTNIRELKDAQKKQEQLAFLMGTHQSAGKNSSVFRFFHHPLFARPVLAMLLDVHSGKHTRVTH